MNYYLYNQQPAVTDYYHYYSARIFSFFVRDTHGVECYLAGFGADVYPDGLKQYLSNRFPNYYIPDFYTPSFTFSEIQLGYSYKMHYRKYVLEPKFLLGIGRFNNFSDIYTFKEKGSNQFINYSIYDNRLSKYVLSYHLQLHLARRIFIKGSPHFKMEVGVKSEILLAPYKASVKIATDAYGQPATDNQFNYKDVFKMYSWGAFWAIYLGR